MNKTTKTYERSMAGLRDALFDELEDLRAGVSAPHEAIAFAKLANHIIGSADIEQRESVKEAKRLRLEQRQGMTLIEGASGVKKAAK